MKKEYQTGKASIDKEIDQLTRKYSTPETRVFIHDMLMTAVKLHLDGASPEDLYLASTTSKELRHIFRTFAKYKCDRKVVIFGSHRTEPCNKEYKISEEFARKITDQGWYVITGGGGGVMEAGNKGAGKRGFAVKIKLPNEFEPNQYVNFGEKLIFVKYFYTRKIAFIKESDATVLFPGGFGTHDESFEALTLLSTGKDHPRPIVMVEAPFHNYWHDWLNFVKRQLLKNNFVTTEDFNLFTIVRSADEAAKEVTNFYRHYHSIRYGKGLTVIRLNKRLPVEQLVKLSKKHAKIMDGEITPCGPLPSEVRAKELLELPRIGFNFNRQNFGGLMALIRDINKV